MVATKAIFWERGAKRTAAYLYENDDLISVFCFTNNSFFIILMMIFFRQIVSFCCVDYWEIPEVSSRSSYCKILWRMYWSQDKAWQVFPPRSEFTSWLYLLISWLVFHLGFLYMFFGSNRKRWSGRQILKRVRSWKKGY